MSTNPALIDTQATNPNLDRIHQLFYRRLSKYFDAKDLPKPEYFEDVACYNCGTTATVSEFVIARFRHVRCAKCGMVYVSPRIKENILHDSYDEEDYTEHYRLKLIPSLKYRREVLGKRKYEQVAAHFKKPGSILDIGCGLGELLSVFKDHGWSCLGIEFNKFAARFAQETFGLAIVDKSIFDFPANAQFDCIMLWGVLEHFTKPVEVLLKVHQLLREDGLLLLEVPNADSILVHYYEQFGGYIDRIIEGDRHIMLFSIRSLQEMTRRAGFTAVQMQSNGLDLDTLLRLNKENISPELVARIQLAIDQNMSGDLLRCFFKKE